MRKYQELKKQAKLGCLGCLASLFIFSNTAIADEIANEEAPTYNSAYFKDGKLINKHMGKLGAVEGVVQKVEPGPKGNPIYVINLTGLDQSIWVGSMLNIDIKMVDVGTTVKVLGFFDETAKETEFMSKLTKDPAYILGFCFLDSKTGRPMYLNQWMKKCIEWEHGKKLKEISQ
ncbi:MAG: hypothetical protein MJK04_19685 [Psychrosphaera sp.]|nr:hypothetical protein [Psychrosphaera sp.]